MEFSAQDFELIKTAILKDATVQGFVTGSGLEAIQLDEYAKLLYAIFYPQLQKTPHISPEMAGQRWGGTSYQFKAIVNPNATSLPAAVSPGNRNAIASITSDSYAAPYCTLGYDQEVQFEEYEFARGLDDLQNLARVTTVHNILKNYDVLVTNGNRGTASNGFKLGTAHVPTAAGTGATGGSIASSATVYCRVVELTAQGLYNNPLSTTGVVGVQNTITRTPANGGNSEVIPAGVGIPSTTSASQQSGSSTSANTVTRSGSTWN
jgi:hypothetical protein